MGPYPALILIGEPNVASSLEIGSLTSMQPNQVIYMIRLNGGELGTPGVEITISAPAINNTAPALSVTICYEPGVHAGISAEEDWYNLNTFQAQWLGASGGGGRMYRADPSVIGNSPLDVKKQTLRVQITAHGFVPSDPAVLKQLQRRFSTAGNPHARVLDRLTSSDFTGKFYFTIPDVATTQMYNDDVLRPLQRAYLLRLPPYHQYSGPGNVIGLEMDELPGFRRHMMCDRTFQGTVPTYSAPHKLLPDTIGRRDVRLVTMIHGLGVCREEQAHDMYCRQLGNVRILIKLVRSPCPVLAKATRDTLANNIYGPAAEPRDHYVYMGYCKIVSPTRLFPIPIPRPGSLGFISWLRQDGQTAPAHEKQAFGMVLAPHGIHSIVRADFVMALTIRELAMRQRASPDPITAQPEHALFQYIRNRRLGQRQVDALKRLGMSTIMNPVLTNLRTSVIVQDIQVHSYRDLSGGPEHQHPQLICANAVQWFLHSSVLSNYTAEERNVLHLVFGIDGYIHRVRTTTGGGAARSVYALMAVLMLVGYRVLVAIDEPIARSEFAHSLHLFLQALETDPMSQHWYYPNLRSKRIVCCSIVEMDIAPITDDHSIDLSSPFNPLRRKLRLVFYLMLGGLAEEAVLYDTGAYYSSSASNPPTNCTPQAWSMADCTADYLLRHSAQREQYYADRASILNPGFIPEDELIAIEERVQRLHQAIFAEQDVIICDYNTAMSSEVVKSLEKHIVILGNTQRTAFSKTAATIVRHSSLDAAILLGYPADQRFGPMQLASRDRNEAMTTFGKSAWDVLETADGSPSTNVI